MTPQTQALDDLGREVLGRGWPYVGTSECRSFSEVEVRSLGLEAACSVLAFANVRAFSQRSPTQKVGLTNARSDVHEAKA